MNQQEIIEAWGELVMPSRWPVFQEVITRVGYQNLFVLETGTMINTANGGSTLFWGTHPAVMEIHTIDINTVGWERLMDHPRISMNKLTNFHNAPTLAAIAGMPGKYFDILYLDSDADHVLTLHEYLTALPKLKLPAMVLADDFETKCKLLNALIDGQTIPHSWNDYGGFRASAHTSGKQIYAPANTCGMLMFRVDKLPTFESVR